MACSRAVLGLASGSKCLWEAASCSKKVGEPSFLYGEREISDGIGGSDCGSCKAFWHFSQKQVLEEQHGGQELC